MNNTMFRIATKEEKEHYIHTLYPFQDEIFPFVNCEKFYLTGGTCVSRFYYNHRYSDDLDFFFRGDIYSKEEFLFECREIINQLNKNFKVEVGIISDTYIRIIGWKNEIPLKLEFVNEPFAPILPLEKRNSLLIDTKKNILSNKLTAVFGRKTWKDYVDLYYLLKEFDLEEGIILSENKMVPPGYESAINSLTSGKTEGLVLLVDPIIENDFEEFIRQLIRGLLDHAKKIL